MENDLTDLIDRNALLKKWDEKFFAMGADRLGCNGDEIMWYINSLLDEIKNAPTIEQPQGEWINGDNKCSCCGKSKFEGLDADIWADWQPKFCPNCGAKMKQG